MNPDHRSRADQQSRRIPAMALLSMCHEDKQHWTAEKDETSARTRSQGDHTRILPPADKMPTGVAHGEILGQPNFNLKNFL